ncbi:hypothetical protein [Thermoflexus hugenholtzii]
MTAGFPSIEQLRLLWTRWQGHWQEARRIWQDRVAEQFEQEFVEPWTRELPAFLKAAEALAAALKAAPREE